MQWNSSLAVNYPARDKFQIKRGDNFETIANKSRGECVTIHLPVTPVVDDEKGRSGVPSKAIVEAEVKEGMVDNDNCKAEEIGDGVIEEEGEAGDESAIKIAYDKEFNQPQHIREQMYKMEKNKMRYPSEGKANLDRYRLASSRIFSLIYEVCALCRLPLYLMYWHAPMFQMCHRTYPILYFSLLCNKRRWSNI